MSADATPAHDAARTVRPTGICVVRSEPIDHRRLYSITTSLDVLQASAQRSQRSSDIDEVLRIVARFLHESQ
jgi:hypothetical protein